MRAYSVCVRHEMFRRQALRPPVVKFVARTNNNHASKVNKLSFGYTAYFQEMAPEVKG